MKKMTNKLQELLNRKPGKWGNVSWRAFEQDIELLQTTITEQQTIIDKQNAIIANCACSK